MSSIAHAIPLALALWGAIICSKVQLFNVSLEGQIAAGAFVYAACVVSFSALGWSSFSTGAGAVTIALAARSCLGGAFGLAVARGRFEPIVTGIALNLLAVGAMEAVRSVWLDELLGPNTRIGNPGPPGLHMHEAIAVRLALLVLLTGVSLQLFFQRTTYGRRASAVGFSEDAARQAGVDVESIRVRAGILCGTLCGASGISLVLLTEYYRLGIGGGRGFLALALALIAGGSVWRGSIAVLFYGVIVSEFCWEFLRDMLVVEEIPPEVISSFPYVLAIGAVVVVSGLRRSASAK